MKNCTLLAKQKMDRYPIPALIILQKYSCMFSIFSDTSGCLKVFSKRGGRVQLQLDNSKNVFFTLILCLKPHEILVRSSRESNGLIRPVLRLQREAKFLFEYIFKYCSSKNVLVSGIPSSNFSDTHERTYFARVLKGTFRILIQHPIGKVVSPPLRK